MSLSSKTSLLSRLQSARTTNLFTNRVYAIPKELVIIRKVKNFNRAKLALVTYYEPQKAYTRYQFAQRSLVRKNK
jgi:hypothetical protein